MDERTEFVALERVKGDFTTKLDGNLAAKRQLQMSCLVCVALNSATIEDYNYTRATVKELNGSASMGHFIAVKFPFFLILIWLRSKTSLIIVFFIRSS